VGVVAGFALLGSGHQPSGRAHGGTTPRGHHNGHRYPPPGLDLVPASGAYLGAYIQPPLYNSAGEIAAVRSFQQQTGRTLSLVHVYRPWQNPFPTQSDRYFAAGGKILLITWSGQVDTKKIIAGTYDAMIRQRADALRQLGSPVLLEFRHEMDRPNLQRSVHGPRNFIAAWEHIRAIFAAAGASNVSWVWCPTGFGFRDGRALPFYPGAAEVDWVCADVYSPTPDVSLAQSARPFLRFAIRTGKPVIIGEFGVGGDKAGWPHWLAVAGRLPLAYPQVKAMVYFDANGTDSNGRPFRYWLGTAGRALASFARLMAAPRFQPPVPAGQ
jgi:hypothetical protein